MTNCISSTNAVDNCLIHIAGKYNVLSSGYMTVHAHFETRGRSLVLNNFVEAHHIANLSNLNNFHYIKKKKHIVPLHS